MFFRCPAAINPRLFPVFTLVLAMFHDHMAKFHSLESHDTWHEFAWRQSDDTSFVDCA